MENNKSERERLGSRLGFILLSAGCAIGLGNVWKFPWMAGMYGGGAFVAIYLFFLVVMGLPVMTMEFATGRAAQKSPIKLFNELEPSGSHFHIYGKFALAGNYLLMMFYTVISGWILQYFFYMGTGKFEGLDANGVAGVFGAMLGDPISMVIFMIIVIIAGFAINSLGLQKGIGRVGKYMMLALLIVMVVLAINSLSMPGAKEGIDFYLKPSLAKMREVGIWNVVVGAMNQAFFTLSLGIGAMAIFGSYIDKERSLLGESINVTILDTFVALTAGLIIFPACFTHGVEVGAGPSLIFITLPNIFNNISMGRIWGSLFFVFMTFAAFSTVLAVFENIMSCTSDQFGWSRKQSAFINCILMIFLSLPCALGFNIWSGFTPFGPGSGVLDLEDFLVSNLLLPGGSFIFVLFCTLKRAWGWENFETEANHGKGAKIQKWMRGYCTFVLPVIIMIILVLGLIPFIGKIFG